MRYEDDPRPFYAAVDRDELKAVYERVVTLLDPSDTWEGKVKDVSWPKDLLRLTGTEEKPFEEEVEQEEVGLNDKRNEDDDDDDDDDEGDDNEEEHEDQAALRLDDLSSDNSRSSPERASAVIEGLVE
ncbi:hypothetical protein FRC17_010072 [Serendipita sp. 399]|nr:hypothetical protein FRC17_010072 [Serendipita sp. 399]